MTAISTPTLVFAAILAGCTANHNQVTAPATNNRTATEAVSKEKWVPVCPMNPVRPRQVTAISDLPAEGLPWQGYYLLVDFGTTPPQVVFLHSDANKQPTTYNAILGKAFREGSGYLYRTPHTGVAGNGEVEVYYKAKIMLSFSTGPCIIKIPTNEMKLTATVAGVTGMLYVPDFSGRRLDRCEGVCAL